MIEAARQAWPPFVLVAGLLLIGQTVEADRFFEALASRIERLGGGASMLLAALLVLDALVTAVLNLDTAAVFMTPINVHAARRRGCDERPFVYGSLLIANGASILLPGSNLTNLIVLAHDPPSGTAFARAMALPWLSVVAVIVAVLLIAYRPRGETRDVEPPAPFRWGLGVAATVAATVLMLALGNPALPVAAVGVAVVFARRIRPSFSGRVLIALFVLAVALGTVARHWDGPARLVGELGAGGAAALGAVASVLINNLPAAALLSARAPAMPLPLLLGLNLGPNLAVSGSLSAYLWFVSCRRLGVRPSLRTLSLLGLLLAPLTIAVALGVLAATDAPAF